MTSVQALQNTGWFRCLMMCPLLGICIGLLCGSPARAATTHHSLQKLTGVKITVAASDELKQDGLNVGQIINDIEGVLGEAGIRILSQEQWRQAKGRPYLNVQINSTKIQDNWKFYTYSIHIQLVQDVYLARLEQSETVPAATWFTSVSGHGYLGDIRIKIKETMGLFVEDFQSGPKP